METMSNLQLEIFAALRQRRFGNGVSDESLREIKTILAKYFADKASDAIDKVWEEKNLTEEDMIVWARRTQSR